MQSSAGSQSYGWSEPLCLIENLKGREMKVNRETAAKLSRIDDKLVVVAIVGLYRTGKSYLMNRLAGKKSGFQLGNTVQAMTKGIWIWCVPHPLKSNTCLALLDTEGLGDVEKGDSKNDAMLFTLAALLSSTLVYNSKGTIDQQAMDSLHFVTEIAEQVKVNQSGKSSDDDDDDDDDDTKLIEYFPSFVWAVRDFVLELKVDGQQITSNEYLENALNLKKGASKKVTEFNFPRRCIRRYFPNRRCFTFPLPVRDPSHMGKLADKTEQQLAPQFIATAAEFCDHIFHTSPIKTVSGLEFTGHNFACLASQYVEDLSAGHILCIQSVVSATADRINEDVLKACVQLYVDKITTETSGKLPVECNDELNSIHLRCQHAANELLSRRAMVIDADGNLGQKLSEMIGKEYEKICKTNEELSEQASTSILKKLHKNIHEKLESTYYFKIGGYSEYQSDIGSMVCEYLLAPGKGVKAMDVLDDFMTRQSASSKFVMSVDKNLTEQQKRSEGPLGRTRVLMVLGLAVLLLAVVLSRWDSLKSSRTAGPIKSPKSFKKAFEGRKAELAQTIDVAHGLWTELEDKKVLTKQQIADCKIQKTDSEKAEKMMELLEKRENSLLTAFCMALIENGQRSVVVTHFNSDDMCAETL